MTVYPDGQKESLHGHNYSVRLAVDLKDVSLPKMISFSAFKKQMKTICEAWDEKVILAQACPFFKVTSHSTREIEFSLCGKRYVLPTDEVVLLPLDNITTETLAYEFCRLMIEGLGKKFWTDSATRIEARVEEIPGQGSTCSWTITGD